MSAHRTDPTHLAICAAKDASVRFDGIKEDGEDNRDRAQFSRDNFEWLESVVASYEEEVRTICGKFVLITHLTFAFQRWRLLMLTLF